MKSLIGTTNQTNELTAPQRTDGVGTLKHFPISHAISAVFIEASPQRPPAVAYSLRGGHNG